MAVLVACRFAGPRVREARRLDRISMLGGRCRLGGGMSPVQRGAEEDGGGEGEILGGDGNDSASKLLFGFAAEFASFPLAHLARAFPPSP